MRTQKIAPIPLLLTLFGLAAGIGATSISMQETDFPVDMIIYREGVQAFFGGRDVYAVPMYAGDLALPFIYPPFGAVALWPLSSTSLPHSVAGNIMIGVSAALLLLCLFFVFRAVGVAREWLWPVTAAAWAVGMLIEPVTLNNGFAQINIVLMALVILDLVPRRRWLPQGSLIGLAIAIKISPAAMLLYFLLKKKIWPIVTAGLTAAVATLLSALVNWEESVTFFKTTLLDMGASGDFGVDPSYSSNSSLKGVLLRMAGEADNSTLLNLIWVVLVLGLIIGGGWLMWTLQRKAYATLSWQVNAMIMLLISPISWSHHWVWLAVIIPTVAYVGLTALPQRKPSLVVVGIWAALVLTLPPKWWFGDGIVASSGLSLFGQFLVADFVWLALALMVTLAVDTRRAPEASDTTAIKEKQATAPLS
ncbi:glycosyltransferase 87 family protein [Corynebacterium renale]|uniref:glycosyltransferase 87 family protein n=1 Tax=Corynebacterium renale TaxID=1724 RepID=UPI000DFDC7CE|nr:glycosyltransferase 87 family protein [Corynebacterium renale]STC95518.1 hypothetical membrane protein [Corynebacterium renale]